MHAASDAAYLMPECLRRPAAIFEGVRWDEDDDDEADGWLCYVYSPDRAFRSDGSRRAPYEAEVFLVFLNADRIVYAWGWEDADESDGAMPYGYESRFHRRLFP